MKNKMIIPAVLFIGGVLVMGGTLILAVGGAESNTLTAPPAESQPREAAGTAGSAVEPAVVSEPAAVAAAGQEQPASVSVEAAGEADAVVIPVAADNKTGKPEQLAISLHLDDVEVLDVIKLFTRITPLNVTTTGTNLQGTVSVDLENVPWKVALDRILEQRGLMLYDPDGVGVYSIVPKPIGVPDPLVMETVFLKFAEVPSVITVLRNALDPRGKIADFSSRNAMVIQSTRGNLSELKKIVEDIDIPRRQVYIEAKFMELKDTAIKTLGTGWQMLSGYEVGGAFGVLSQSETFTESQGKSGSMNRGDTRANSDAMGGSYNVNGETMTPNGKRTRTTADSIGRTMAASMTMNESASRTFSDIRTAVLSPLTFNVILSALKTQDGISILSNPKIIVANGEQAMIHIGEERRPFVATVTPATQMSAPITTYTPGEAVNFGVLLTVTPTINTDSNITVIIAPELTRLVGFDTAPNGQTYPIKGTKKIATQFSLQNGQTAAIGGLTETQDTKTTKKVPLLGDIPLIGKYLFSHEADSTVQQETIIFVTVGLANPESTGTKVGVPDDAELVHKDMINRSVKKQEFRSDLERMEDDARKREERAAQRKKLLLSRPR